MSGHPPAVSPRYETGARFVVQAVDFIKKSAAQNSIDLMGGPSHAGPELLRIGLVTKLSTESVRLCLHANKPRGDGGLGG